MSLLYDEQPMVLLPSLAKELENLNEAVFLQQLHYWLQVKKREGRNFIEGHYWVFNSHEEWMKQFVWMSKMTLRRTINSLMEKGYIIRGNFNRLRMDHTTWYTIDYNRIRQMEEKVEQERIAEAETALCLDDNNTAENPMSMDLPEEPQQGNDTPDSHQSLAAERCVQNEHIDMSETTNRYVQNEHFDVFKLHRSFCSK